MCSEKGVLKKVFWNDFFVFRIFYSGIPLQEKVLLETNFLVSKMIKLVTNFIRD